MFRRGCRALGCKSRERLTAKKRARPFCHAQMAASTIDPTGLVFPCTPVFADSRVIELPGKVRDGQSLYPQFAGSTGIRPWRLQAPPGRIAPATGRDRLRASQAGDHLEGGATSFYARRLSVRQATSVTPGRFLLLVGLGGGRVLRLGEVVYAAELFFGT